MLEYIAVIASAALFLGSMLLSNYIVDKLIIRYGHIVTCKWYYAVIGQVLLVVSMSALIDLLVIGVMYYVDIDSIAARYLH